MADKSYPWAFNKPSNWRINQAFGLELNGKTAPSAKDTSPSGITRSSSTSMVLPMPKQAGQAPNGLLNENIRGSIAGKEIWQSGQAKCWLYMCDGPSISCTTTIPSPHLAAVSMESDRRLSMPSLTTKRSITISKSCFLVLASSISSSKVRISPSTRTRANPSLRRRSNNCLCSPFLPRNKGAIMSNLVRSGKVITSSVICSIDCCEIGLPHCGQYAWPTRANNNRK